MNPISNRTVVCRLRESRARARCRCTSLHFHCTYPYSAYNCIHSNMHLFSRVCRRTQGMVRVQACTCSPTQESHCDSPVPAASSGRRPRRSRRAARWHGRAPGGAWRHGGMPWWHVHVMRANCWLYSDQRRRARRRVRLLARPGEGRVRRQAGSGTTWTFSSRLRQARRFPSTC
eukprot:COSAG02_NODE_3149_length_7284_cov_3.179262_2_plen_174_part_00